VDPSESLAAALLAVVAGDAGASADDIEPVLRALVEDARAAWPGVEIDPRAFVTYVGERLVLGKGVLSALEEAQTRDLYLACACVRGDATAIERFETLHAPEIARALSFAGIDASSRDDVLSKMREILYFPRISGAPPLIATYSGRGRLRSWAQSVALREARRLALPKRSPAPTELALACDTGADPEMAYLRTFYVEEFRSALGRALQDLSRRDRVLLRQHYIDQLSLPALAASYRLHRATVARHVAEARERVLARTKEELVAALQLRPSELESLLRFVREENVLDSSLGAALRGVAP
jgi:RNA polymerase sigma-70 factor (ECF subfamily)